MREKWFERRFNFDIPVARMPYLIERLRGTPARIEEKVRRVTASALTSRFENTWSIQENIGHLTDLEQLHLARLEDLEQHLTDLRPADLTNKPTWDANHNSKTIAAVCREFRTIRQRLVSRLEQWKTEELDFHAMHPRLKVPMRAIDVAVFAAEHDDYHMERVHELVRQCAAS